MKTGQLIVEVSDERAAFMLELLESIRFVSNSKVLTKRKTPARVGKPAKPAPPETAD